MNITLWLMGLFLAVVIVFWRCLSYVVHYKKTTCDTSVSPNKKHEIVLQTVGEPGWPFGSARGRLLLMEGKETISQTDFEWHDDGGSITSTCWKVTWHEGYAEVLLSGEEPLDERVHLYFDGSVDIEDTSLQRYNAY